MTQEERHKLKIEFKQIITPSLEMRLNLLQAPLISLEQIITQFLEINPALEIEESKEDQEVIDETMQILKDYCPYFFDEEEEREEVEGKRDRSYIKDFLSIKIAKRFFGEKYKIAKVVLENLNSKGLLEVSPKELAKRYSWREEKVNEVIEEMKRIGPLGVAASSPQEVLLLKLKESEFSEDSLEYRIVKECFDELKSHNFKGIKDKLKKSRDEVMVAVRRITMFSPYPFIDTEEKNPPFVIPDVIIKWKEGRYIALPNRWNIPKIKISAELMNILNNKEKYDKDTISFVKKSISEATRFIKAIKEREQTIVKLGEIIAEKEAPFFEGEQSFPLIIDIEDVIANLGISFSTFYRAVHEKYVDTPKGLFPMGIFFSKKKTQKGIESAIKNIIDSEDSMNPYTDEEIAERLREMGFEVSRRTVASYRKKLNIPGRDKRFYFKGS